MSSLDGGGAEQFHFLLLPIKANVNDILLKNNYSIHN